MWGAIFGAKYVWYVTKEGVLWLLWCAVTCGISGWCMCSPRVRDAAILKLIGICPVLVNNYSSLRGTWKKERPGTKIFVRKLLLRFYQEMVEGLLASWREGGEGESIIMMNSNSAADLELVIETSFVTFNLNVRILFRIVGRRQRKNTVGSSCIETKS